MVFFNHFWHLAIVQILKRSLFRQEWRELLVGLAFWCAIATSVLHCVRPDDSQCL
jgi:hypothetical protein